MAVELEIERGKKNKNTHRKTRKNNTLQKENSEKYVVSQEGLYAPNNIRSDLDLAEC